MLLPFTHEQFLGVFRAYNEAVWPAQAVLLALAAACVALVALGKGDRVVSSILAAMWLWMGVAYHAVFFTSINPAAWLFAAIFVAGAAAFAWAAAPRSRWACRRTWRCSPRASPDPIAFS